MSKTSLFLLSALFSHSLLAAPMVEAFLDDPVPVLDEQGRALGDRARSNLPKQAIPVLQYNKELDLVQVEVSGERVWLDTMTVRVNPPLNVVKLPCQKLSNTRPEDQQDNSTIGFGAGCSK
ncbi:MULTISPECIES: hypothetical protein [unclassified Pseudomonas]|uniref:hypothetical protein n=1 Tax=unclassified Pseudomonas TaxID=196821 RepID=UPI00244B0920|nr:MULTISPECIES: hypothetical protein [unclassified Pseudomonas]MDH0304051.1 hypothetical protein [Pseudomonas sp. GD04091]MDH1987838.1 hypothetical protein [Pseudomonas sp. GD03689]